MASKAPYVVAVIGSPHRKGTCDALCEQVLAGAAKSGATVEKFYLQELEIHPCDACETCHAKGSGSQCMIADDMMPLYPKLKECDVLVIASPIFFFSLSAQTKLFLDRLYPFVTENGMRMKMKHLVACLSYGASDPLESGVVNAVGMLRDFCLFSKRAFSCVHVSSARPADLRKNSPAMQNAHILGKRIGKTPGGAE